MFESSFHLGVLSNGTPLSGDHCQISPPGNDMRLDFTVTPPPPHPPTAQRPRGRSCHAVSSFARLSVICYKTVKVWWYVGKTFVKGMCAWGSKTIKNEEEKMSTTCVFDFHDSRIYVFTAHFSVVCATFKDQELCYLMGNPSWPTDLCSISSALALSTLILLHIIERRF